MLVVDDEEDILEIARLSLERLAGWSVVTASSGPDALQMARTESVEAVLLDVMMPGTDGPATVALLKADEATRHIPIVLLTAKAQSSDRQELNKLDIAGILQKPFDPVSLAGEVATVLGWDDG
ncbi:response regulator [Mycobacterium sp. Y57]|uniref:response regulator n=1 Tax=Mycolicibacterium xanthum TaxID=2796469 RepID=UPI001C842CFB|nr:response regulator [Mycolicibacterium xanthum]MBX7435476.1 response regulator [Mycolicibacterium xanthum]